MEKGDGFFGAALGFGDGGGGQRMSAYGDDDDGDRAAARSATAAALRQLGNDGNVLPQKEEEDFPDDMAELGSPATGAMAHAEGRGGSRGADGDWAEERADPDAFDEASDVQRREFAFCTTSKIVGRSGAYEYCHEIKINPDRAEEDLDFAQGNEALQMVATGHYMICMLCKEDNLPLRTCLKKIKKHRITNFTKHLSTKHKEVGKELEKKRRLETPKVKHEGNDEPPKKRKRVISKPAVQLDKYFSKSKSREEVEQWLLARLPTLQRQDAEGYRDRLVEDGFDSLAMLEVLEEGDLGFMKTAHRRVLTKMLRPEMNAPSIAAAPGPSPSSDVSEGGGSSIGETSAV